MNTELQNILELLVDEHCLADVLNALVSVCGEKADHLRGNWQDDGSAEAWDRMGKLIAGVAAKCDL
jgi:hypothetical protein